MLGSVGRPVSATGVLRREERRVKVLRDVMSSLHDLEGAAEARQSGVAVWSLQNLVLHAVLHRVVSGGFDLPEYDRVEQEWYDAVQHLEQHDTELARRVRHLYTTIGSLQGGDSTQAVLGLVSELVYEGQPVDATTARDEWVRELARLKAEIRNLSGVSTEARRERT